MYFIDSHLHLTDMTWRNMEDMYLCGIRAVVSPVHLPAFKPVSAQTIREMWDYQLEKQLGRAEQHFIRAYAMIGISMVSTPEDGLDKLLSLLPNYLKNEQVVAIGEIGFEPSSKTCSDIAFQEEILRGQLEIAKDLGVVVDIHVPNTDERKKVYTEKSLELCKEYSLNMSKVVIDHCSDANIEMVLESGAYASITVQPWRNMSPDLAADLVIKHGSDRITINSDCGDGHSDPLSVPRTALALKRKGVPKEVIKKVCYLNSKELYGI